MATHAVHSQGSGARYGTSGSTTSHAPMPGSPTLTNPDMILPDYDYPDERSQSPMGWDNVAPGHLNYQLPPPDAFIAGPMIPTTPIIYGNGTMLSDIGEVTEVESVVGAPRRPSSHFSHHDVDIPLRSSPTMGQNRMKRRSQIKSRGRTSSIDSNSTITTMDQDAAFADFDDGGSADDLDFQGDDEESMASEYVEGIPAREQELAPRPGIRSNENRFSTNSLSEKAEQILANAKQRLTTMEGNLSKARSSLYYSAISDGSTPSPPIVRPATSLRESTLSPSSHARMMSEMGHHGGAIPTGFPQRSASALGAAGGYRQPLTSSRSADALGGAYAGGGHKFSHQPLDTTLESPGEDDAQSNVDNRHGNSYLPDVHSPTFGSPPLEKELTRSVSVAQMRDLKDQMKDLKGKISSLKEQARVDSMKRRSLQSLRTPSPFTHARWDQGYMEQKAAESSHDVSPLLQESWNQDDQEPAVDKTVPRYGPDGALELDEIDFRDARESSDQDEMKIGLGVSQPDQGEDRRPSYDDEDLLTEDGDEDEDEALEDVQQENFQDADYEPAEEQEDDDAEDYVSESGDSLYHDTFQHPVSHEDREDAFDYEHFFLHSAMGSMSQQRYGRRGSTDSITSEESVETTKGPYMTRERRPSMDTMSSVDTFATAHEGRASRSSALKHDIRETVLTPREDFDGPPSGRRSTFDGSVYSRSANSSGYFQPSHYRGGSVAHRPSQSTSVIPMHRPSISSFESTGTNRSFPLVSKAKLNGGVLTPGGTPGSTPNGTPGGSPDPELKQVSQTLLKDATTVAESRTETSSRDSPTIQLLSKEDQILVERLVASLGKCVLGLSEASRASSEARAYRRRIDRARKILEGMED